MRKSKPKKRYILPDPIYGDTLVTKFVNYLMVDGKKSLSYGIFYDAIKIVEEKTSENGIETWKSALKTVMPSVEVKSRRVGGATFQVPIEVRPERKTSLKERLAGEIIAAAKGEGASVKKKDDTHRMAEANKAFSHFRF
jgi:small subunit ribosomal protein S7